MDNQSKVANHMITHADLSNPGTDRQHLQMKLHTDENSLSALKELWDDLALRSDAPICMSYMWVKNWWNYFGKHKKRSLYIITIWSADQLIAIAPFYKGHSTFLGKVAYQRLQLIGSGGRANEQFGFTDDYGVSDSLDFIVDPDHSSVVSELFLEWCEATLSEIDTISFHQAEDSSFIKKFLYPKLKKSSLVADVRQTDIRPIINLKGISNLKEYIKQVKSNARRRFRQTLRATKPKGREISFKEFHSIDEIETAMDKLIELHQERWNALGYPGLFHDERFTGFFKEIVRTSYYDNRLWFKHTCDEKGISSSRLLLLFNKTYYDYLSGIDIDCPSSKYRPGYALLLNAVDEAIKSEIEYVDLLRGDETYKFDFTETIVKNWKIVLSKKGNLSVPKKFIKKLIYSSSFIYKHVVKEKELLGQQYRNEGFPGMFIPYSQNRFNRLLEKIRKG